MSPCGAAPNRGMPAVRLWLVRHSRPLGGEGLCYGRLDLPVDEAEVAQVAAALASSLPAGLVLRSSPARRCRLLADALLARRPDLRSGGPVPAPTPTSTPAPTPTPPPTPCTGQTAEHGRGQTAGLPTYRPSPASPVNLPSDGEPSASGRGCLAALAEMDFGAWEGRPWAEVPEAELSAWTDDFADHAPGGTGECVRDFLSRVRGMLAALPMADGQTWCLRPADGFLQSNGIESDRLEGACLEKPGIAGLPSEGARIENTCIEAPRVEAACQDGFPVESPAIECAARQVAGDERVCPPPPAGSGESTQRPSGDVEVWITHAGVIRAVAWLLGEGQGGRMPQAAQWPLFKVDYGQVWCVQPALPNDPTIRDRSGS